MGKQLSKANLRSSRRQRSQVMSQVTSPNPPRIASETTDRAIMTLKLQRDELTVYKGRLNTLLRKEEDTIRRLLKEDKIERAKLLLQKKRLQEHILHETERQLNSIINQATSQGALDGIRKEVDLTIDKNGEAMKRLHNLLSLDHAELMLRESQEGTKKQSEVDQLLLLATVGEREFVEKEVEAEMRKLIFGLGMATRQHGNISEEQEETLEESNELEALGDRKLKETLDEIEKQGEEEINLKADVVEDTSADNVAEEKAPAVVVDNAVSNESGLSEMNAVAVDAEDDKSGSSGEEGTTEKADRDSVEVTSSIFPDVPSHSIDVNNEDIAPGAKEKQVVQKTEVVAEAENM